MADADRHLLFGLIALQVGLIDQAQLVAAFQAWARDKARPLANHLAVRGDLDTEGQAAVEAMVALHLRKHDGDPQRSLVSIPAGRSTRERLNAVGDAELAGSVARLGSGAPEPNPDRTITYAVSTATGDGQRFRVLRPHAEGGLGAVFVALDGELHREVALKQILDSHADDPVSRQRFLLEAQVTGGLEHPGIVPVYGLGTYADGRPYYAMRFIRGDSLKEAIERFHSDEGLRKDPGRRSLEWHKLLRRFTDVCNAVEYAHSRGVLHRDIKPGNIIVGRHGETLVVDWGLAKAMGRGEPGAEERTLLPSSGGGSAETLPGSVLGTPAFMSPEQAAGDLASLGPASDVYSLGATLYCLLTGKPPFEGGPVGMVLDKVRRGLFSRPRSVLREIPRPLEAIAQKAMSLEPADRYRTPKALAEDVERWMADEPVAAWREPWTARARRWTARHRPLVVGVLAASLVALLSLALATLLLARSESREREARLLAQNEKAKADANAQVALAERSRALENARLARQAVDEYFVKVSESRLLHEPGMDRLRGELLGVAKGYYETFVAQRKDDPDLRMELGWSFFRLAKVSYDLGSRAEAFDQMKNAVAIFSDLMRPHPSEDMPRIALVTSQDKLAAMHAMNGQSELAEDLLRQTLPQWEALAAEAPENHGRRNMIRSTLINLANIHMQTGRVNESLREYGRAIEIGEQLVRDKPDDLGYRGALALSYSNRAVLELNTGRLDAAEQDLAQARTRFAALVQKEPRVPGHRKSLAECLGHFGSLKLAQNRAAPAEEALNEAIAIYETLAREHPDVGDYRHRQGSTLNQLGLLFLQTNRPRLAEPPFRKAAAILEELAKTYPAFPDYRYEMAMTLNDMGGMFVNTDRLADGESLFRRASAIRQELADQYPARLDFAAVLGASQNNMGIVRAMRRDPEDARRWLARGGLTLEAVLQRDPRNDYAKRMLLIGRREQVKVLSGMNRHGEAVQAWDSLIDRSEPGQRPALRIARAESLARAGEPARAAEEIAALVSGPGVAGEMLLDAARTLAIASTILRTTAPDLAERHDSLACDCLARAARAGAFQDRARAARMTSDPDLARLRTRRDFPARILDQSFPADPYARP
jgi:serine/threonine-protein kinase